MVNPQGAGDVKNTEYWPRIAQASATPYGEPPESQGCEKHSILAQDS